VKVAENRRFENSEGNGCFEAAKSVTVHGLAGAVLESRSGVAMWNQEESNSREGIGCPLKSAPIA
jgi:hypothetical protein